MNPQPLGDLLRGYVNDPPQADLCVSGLSADSRSVQPGQAFVALPGLRQHGIRFAAQAAQRGAAVILLEGPLPADLDLARLPLPAIEVPSLRRELGAIAARWYGEPARQLRVVGVTGTNGKTSSVHLLAQCLSAAGESVGVIGTLGNGLHGSLRPGTHTTPDAIDLQGMLAELRDQGAGFVAMEVSSHALHQHRVAAVPFEIGVFTNLSHDHLDYHGSMDSYAAAKRQLFAVPGLAHAVINIDDPCGRRYAEQLPPGPRLLSYGLAADAELRAEAVETHHQGLRFECLHGDARMRIETALIGQFNVANLLAVIACLRVMGWTPAAIEQACAALQPVPGRMNCLGGGMQAPLLVVDYAHTPDALEKALGALRAHTPGRLICVFGCGGERDSDKRARMGAIAERLADEVIITDDNPRCEPGEIIVDDILSGLSPRAGVRVERNRGRAIAAAAALALPGDTVLIAGKGHEAWQEINGQRYPFDDSEHARRALLQWSGSC